MSSLFISSGNTLDPVLTNERDRITNVEVLSPLFQCQHSPFLFLFFIYLFFFSLPNYWLKANVNKCVVSRIQRGSFDYNLVGSSSNYDLDGAPVRFVNTFSILGITVDVSLKFRQHIHNIVSKAGALASNLLKTTVCCSPLFMVTPFKSYIRLLLTFS